MTTILNSYNYNQHHDSITDMLTYLQWPSLKDRRTVAKLTLLYMIVKKLLIIPNHCLPLQTPVLYTRSQHPLKLTQSQSKLDL